MTENRMRELVRQWRETRTMDDRHPSEDELITLCTSVACEVENAVIDVARTMAKRAYGHALREQMK